MIALPLLPKKTHRMGELIWRDFRRDLVAGVAIKDPRVYDVSSYNVDDKGNYPVWRNTSPMPFGVVCKAGEWGYEDKSFGVNWTELADTGISRAAYWFYHNNQLYYTSARQAKTFVSIIQKYGYSADDYFVIDQEEFNSQGNSIISISETVDFLYNVMVGLKMTDPTHLLIYSTAGLLNALSFAKLVAGQAAFIKMVRIWTAGYPFNPDNFSSPPPAYIPNQARYGDVVLWQYAENAIIPGVPGGTDLNWISENFKVEWGRLPPPPPPPPPPPVVEGIIVKRSLSQYALRLTPRADSLHPDVLPLMTPLDQARKFGWEAAMNCGAGFDYTDATHARVKGFSASAGTIYSTISSGEEFFPSLYVGKDGSISETKPATIWTAIPYDNLAIEGGKVNQNLDNAVISDWSMIGFDDLGNVYLIVTKGREGVYGKTKLQAAQYAANAGVTRCYITDSGHSSSIVADDTLLYSEYGEAIPQTVGLALIATPGEVVKGLAHAVTNIKATVSGNVPAVAQLQVGDSVYGTLVGTVEQGDVFGFDHYFKFDTQRIPLGTMCKAFAGNLTISNQAEPPIVPPPPPPPAARPTHLYRVKWMYQRPAYLRPTIFFAKPDILPGRLESLTDLTHELQSYWYTLLLQHRPFGWSDSQMMKAWASLTGDNLAFTNGHGSGTHHDYINNTNVTQPDMAMDKFRLIGGCVTHRLQPDTVFYFMVSGQRTACAMVEALDPRSHPDPSLINHLMTPWLVGVATIDYGQPTIHVGGFPQLGGALVQVPFFGDGGFNYIPLSCLEALADDAPLPSPFLP